MARKRYKPEEIVAILREADRLGSNEKVIRKHGICEQTVREANVPDAKHCFAKEIAGKRCTAEQAALSWLS